MEIVIANTPKITPMPIESITFNAESWQRKAIDKSVINFKPGVNLLIGPSGAGKSTILRALVRSVTSGITDTERYSVKRGSEALVSHHDFELSERVMGQAEKLSGGGISLTGTFWSHGQNSRRGIATIKQVVAQAEEQGVPVLLIWDEPDLGLDSKYAVEMRDALVSYLRGGDQVIIATHSPILWSTPGANLIELGQPGYLEETLARTHAAMIDLSKSRICCKLDQI